MGVLTKRIEILLIIGSSNKTCSAKKFVYLLDIEFSEIFQQYIKTEKYSYICNVNEKFKHSLHSSNEQLNFIVDLIISLSRNLKTELDINKQILENLLAEFKRYNSNLDSIKEQNNQIINDFRKNTSYTVKENIDSEIDELSDAINKLNISDIKLDKKPKPYKHWIPRK